MQILPHLVLFHRSLKLSSLFKILFSFTCSVWVSPVALPSRSLIFSVSPCLLLNVPSVFFSSIIEFFSSALVLGTFFFFYVLVEVLSVLIHSSPKIYDHYLELHIRQTTYLHFFKVFFWWGLFYYFIWKLFFWFLI